LSNFSAEEEPKFAEIFVSTVVGSVRLPNQTLLKKQFSSAALQTETKCAQMFSGEKRQFFVQISPKMVPY
jgi:hypothetical protein